MVKKKKNPATTKTVYVKAESRLGQGMAAWKVKLKKHKENKSYYVKYFVEVNGQRIPLKDAFRAIFESNAKNDALDSSRILAMFLKLEIPVWETAA